jgi:hypothetical protein
MRLLFLVKENPSRDEKIFECGGRKMSALWSARPRPPLVVEMAAASAAAQDSRAQHPAKLFCIS